MFVAVLAAAGCAFDPSGYAPGFGDDDGDDDPPVASVDADVPDPALPPDAGQPPDAAPPPDSAEDPPPPPPPPDAGEPDARPKRDYGDRCDDDEDCKTGMCRRISGDKVCTEPCDGEESCPGEDDCRESDGFCAPGSDD